MAKALKLEVIGEPLAGVREGFSPSARKGMMDRAVASWRSVIREEWARKSWNRPAGGFFPWAATEAFGDFPANPNTMTKSGRLLGAWLGGSGAIFRYVADGVEFGVSGGAIPYAAVHRGGGGKVLAAQAAQPFKMPVSQKMRGFLHVHGVHLKASTMFLNIPRRPHATANPEVRTRIAAIFAAGLAGKPTPERLTA